jgi:predicted polyphosphate/ATP-dependent NAD kinase
MTDADLYRLWYLWLAIGGAVVLVAASLLVTICLTARGIEREARRALAAVEQIGAATRPIWQLDATNQTAEDLLAAARDLEAHGTAIAAALGGPGPARRTPA